jgi:hypothetical protein
VGQPLCFALVGWRTDNFWGLGKERMRLCWDNRRAPNTEADLLDPYHLDPLLEPYILLQVRSTASTIKKQKVVTAGTILVALSRDGLACGFGGLSCASPGTTLPSELDLLVGGRDRWTG